MNVLGEDQRGPCERFAGPSDDRFEGIDWSPGTTGAPVIAGCVGFVECTRHALVEGGDHVIVIGRVADLDVTGGQDPLVFLGGRYGRFSELS